jgi:hypothetical protein
MNADVFDYPIISAGLMIFVCLDSYKMYLAKTGGDGLPVTSHQEAQNLVSAKFLFSDTRFALLGDHKDDTFESL